MLSKFFGKVVQTDVYKHTLKSDFIEIDVIDYGCIITAVRVKTKNGDLKNVVLGYNTLDEYISDQDYLGAVIGRFSNRIENGRFTLNGKTYQTTRNEGAHSLHGGINGFNTKVWKVAEKSANSIQFERISPDGEEGFPANLYVSVTYTVSGGELQIDYCASSDADTVVSLTNHSYFNLDGVDEDLSGASLYINADYITQTDKELIPHGEFFEVKSTCCDFKVPAPVKRKLFGDNVVAKRGFFDDNFVLNGKGFRKVATLFGKELNMDVFTDREGLQVYSEKDNAVALEAQNFPNAVNCPNFPNAILKKGDIYRAKTIYKFYNK